MSTPAKKSGPASDEVPRPKGRWLAEAHEALLLSIIDSISMESINANKDGIEDAMARRGFTYSYDAIRRHHHPYIAQPSLQVKMSRPATWDDQVYLDVLKAMNNHFRPNAMDCHHMVAGLHAKGHKFSENALLQHLQKLRRKDGTGPAVKNGNGEASGSTPKSAKKRAAPTKKSSAKKTSKFVAEDDSEDLDSPSKRVKYEKVKKEKGVKKEESDEDAKDSVKKEDNSDDENDDFSF